LSTPPPVRWNLSAASRQVLMPAPAGICFSAVRHPCVTFFTRALPTFSAKLLSHEQRRASPQLMGIDSLLSRSLP
jgi:hypothetical protein